MLVFAADLHIAPAAWSSMPKVAGDSYDSFQQIVEYCLQKAPSALILGGDIFDAPSPDPVSVRHFITGVLRLCGAGIPVLAVQGQHGRCRQLSWTNVVDCVTELDPLPLYRVGNFVIKGLDNRTPVDLEAALKTIDPSVNTLILHQACKGALPDRDGAVSWNLDPGWVPDHIRLVLLGDIHRPWETSRTSTKGHTIPMVYSGSIAMQSIDETPRKSFLVVNNDFTYVRVPLKTRYFDKIELKFRTEQEFKDPGAQKLANDAEIDNAAKRIVALPEGALFVVRYDPRLTDVEDALEKVNPRVHLMFKLMPVNQSVNQLDHDIHATTLKECLDQVIDREKEPVFHSFLLDLLQTRNVPETLGLYRTRTVTGE